MATTRDSVPASEVYRDSYVTRAVEGAQGAIQRAGAGNPNMPDYSMIAPATGPARNRPQMPQAGAIQNGNPALAGTLRGNRPSTGELPKSAMDAGTAVRDILGLSVASMVNAAEPAIDYGRGVINFGRGLFGSSNSSSPETKPPQSAATTTTMPPELSGVNSAGLIASRNVDGSVTTDPSRGYIMGLGGGSQLADRARRGIEAGRTVALGDKARNPVSYVDDFAKANKQFAEANRIRQSAIDMMPRGAGVVVPEGQSATDRLRELVETINNPRNNNELNTAYRAANALVPAVSGENQGRFADSQAEAALIRAQQEAAQLNAEAPVRAAEAQERRARAQAAFAAMDDNAKSRYIQTANAYIEAGDFDTGLGMLDALGGLTGMRSDEVDGKANGGLVEGYAGGGFVEPTMQRTMGTGAVGMFGAQGAGDDTIQKYQQYSAKAQELNLPLLGYDEFVNLSGSGVKGYAMGGVVEGYADGGMVDVSGKAVVDTDPNAPTDSIPAVVDGQRPAALDSGEFVIPKDVVQFYGTDKLTKMIEKARNPDGKNGNQQSGAIAAFA
jgi:hypothetical protein